MSSKIVAGSFFAAWDVSVRDGPAPPPAVGRWGDAAEYAKLFRIMKIQLVCLSSFAALCAGAKFIEAHVETRACHLFAAYWRAKRLGLWTEGVR